MGEVISTFHIDVKLLVAQVVNFAIVFVVLYYFGIKPLMKVLQERSQKIDDSLKNAEKIESELADTQSKREDIIKKAKQEASIILAEVNKQGEARKAEMMVKAKEEISAIVAKTKQDLENEKKLITAQIKAETGELVVAAVEKVLAQKLDSGLDKNFIEKIIKEV
ncbi:MAG: F0F1 ATP synthase subunit B [bacterium]|nr:F0F1 ATP synthase subunit B [bacterium]